MATSIGGAEILGDVHCATQGARLGCGRSPRSRDRCGEVVRQRQGGDWVEVAAKTGPLAVLSGERVLAVADAQNLDHGARDLGLRIRWGALGRKLEGAAEKIQRHVVFAEPEGAQGRTQFFAERGWVPHVKRPRWVRSCRGRERISNADGLLLFMTGALLVPSGATLILVCSGDGALVEEVAEAVQQCGPGRRIATLSLAGSTSARLNAACSAFVVANLELGMDCMEERAAPATKGGRKPRGADNFGDTVGATDLGGGR